MKENTKTTRKEFISLGGVRPMKIADEFTSPPIPNDTPRLIIAYALIVLVVIILIGLGIFIYNEVQKEKSYAEGINKVQSLPIQAESNPYRNVKLNKELQVDNDKLEYKEIIIKLKQFCNTIDECQNQFYKENEYFRYVYDKQLNGLFKRTSFENKDIKFLYKIFYKWRFNKR